MATAPDSNISQLQEQKHADPQSETLGRINAPEHKEEVVGHQHLQIIKTSGLCVAHIARLRGTSLFTYSNSLMLNKPELNKKVVGLQQTANHQNLWFITHNCRRRLKGVSLL